MPSNMITIPIEQYEALLDDRDELICLARLAIRRGWRDGSISGFIEMNWDSVK